MYYELYIDVLFLENLMMDSLLLLSVRKIQKLPVGYLRIFTGAMTGTILTCVCVLIKLPRVLKYMIFYVVTIILMIVVGLKQRSVLSILQSAGLLYAIAMLYGGILYFLRPYIRNISLFYGIAAVVYFVVNLFWEILSEMAKQHKNVCVVTVFTSKGTFRLQALEDTGNRLTDPVTGEPVCVVDDKTAKYILGIQSNLYYTKAGVNEVRTDNPIRYIVYRTIAGENMMPVVRVKEMIIYERKKIVIENPLIGICEEAVSEQQVYQMILNPDILGGTKNVSKNSSITKVSN